MKKIFSLSVFVFLCVILLASLSSCAKINVVSAWLKIDSAMDELDSYEMTSTVTIKLYTGGEQVCIETRGTTVEVDKNDKDNCYYYSASSTSVTPESTGVNDDITIIEAYDKGNYFIQSSNGRQTNKKYGPIDIEDFLAYRQFTGSVSVNFSDCKKIKEKENADGTKTIECSGYSGRTLQQLAAVAGIGSGTIGDFALEDVKVWITYDGKYRAKKIDYNFIFEEKEDGGRAPSMRITLEYSKYDEAQKNNKAVDPNEYTEVKDIWIFYKLEMLLAEKANAKSGSFSMHMEQGIKAGAQNISFSEKDTIKYGESLGGFYFNIKANVNNIDMTLKYNNGKLKTKGAGISQTSPMTDSSARAYISSLLNNAMINNANIGTVTKMEEGVYVIKYKVIDTAAYDQMFKPYGGSCVSAGHSIKVTFEDEKLKSVESSIRVNGDGSSYMNVDITNTFN